MPAGGVSGEFEGDADGGSSAGGEEDAVQIAGGEVDEFLGEIDGGAVGVSAGAKGEIVELVFDGGNDAGVGEADLVDVVAVEIEEGLAVCGFDGRTFAAGQDVEAGGGKGLVEEDGGVFIEGFFGFGRRCSFWPIPFFGGRD